MKVYINRNTTVDIKNLGDFIRNDILQYAKSSEITTFKKLKKEKINSYLLKISKSKTEKSEAIQTLIEIFQKRDFLDQELNYLIKYLSKN
jgi:hypothetical protein